MTKIESYREWYEHERDCNQKMLAMLHSVPKENRGDARFTRALVLAAHLAACRENWLDHMRTGGKNQTDWWPESAALDSLEPRYARLEEDWTSYLSELTDERLKRDFEFNASDGTRYRWSIEGQVFQLVGHAYYHRGQIALLVDSLGGETVDTDYVEWAYPKNPRYGPIGSENG